MSKNAHRSALRRARVSVPGHAYFVTKCILESRTNALACQDCAEVLIDGLIWLKDHHLAHICGFVIMPNHYHAVLGLEEDKTLSSIMESVGKYTARQINKLLHRTGTFWEKGFYDHGVRDRSDYDDILTYMHHNPVRAGLVESPELWPYSTAHRKYEHLIDWAWLGHDLHG